MGRITHSRLFTGTVAHKRFKPVHGFKYNIAMAYIDLDELDSLLPRSPLWGVNRRALVEFRRSDYLGDPDAPLDTAVRDRVEQHTGKRPEGPIRMLTHLRTFGYVFNPVTFYYCYDKEDQQVEVIVAEITNTPWKQRHAYILTPEENMAGDKGWHRYLIDKTFHVSPFMDMDYQYDMRFTEPGDKLTVQIDNLRDRQRHFTAVLNMQAKPFTLGNLVKTLLGFPLMTFQVVAGIYWQALKLKLKGAKYVPHPGRKKDQPDLQKAA